MTVALEATFVLRSASGRKRSVSRRPWRRTSSPGESLRHTHIPSWALRIDGISGTPSLPRSLSVHGAEKDCGAGDCGACSYESPAAVHVQ